MFMNFFVTYLDQEHGYLVIRDEERSTVPYHTTRMANFDAARYLPMGSPGACDRRQRLAVRPGCTLPAKSPAS